MKNSVQPQHWFHPGLTWLPRSGLVWPTGRLALTSDPWCCCCCCCPVLAVSPAALVEPTPWWRCQPNRQRHWANSLRRGRQEAGHSIEHTRLTQTHTQVDYFQVLQPAQGGIKVYTQHPAVCKFSSFLVVICSKLSLPWIFFTIIQNWLSV